MILKEGTIVEIYNNHSDYDGKEAIIISSYISIEDINKGNRLYELKFKFHDETRTYHESYVRKSKRQIRKEKLEELGII